MAYNREPPRPLHGRSVRDAARRPVIAFWIATICYWGILIACLAVLSSRPLLVNGRQLQHHPSISIDLITLLVSIICGFLTVMQQAVIHDLAEQHFISSLCRGEKLKLVDNRWSALLGKINILPTTWSRYTFLAVNGIFSAGFISAQFRRFDSSQWSDIQITVGGAALDSKDVIRPYFTNGSLPSSSMFYAALINSNFLSFEPGLPGTLNDATSGNGLIRAVNGDIVIQHNSAFGANYDVTRFRPIRGALTRNETVNVCAQSLRPDAIVCRIYTRSEDVITGLAIADSTVDFNIVDPGMGIDRSFSYDRGSRDTQSWHRNETNGDHLVVFASVAFEDWITISQLVPTDGATNGIVVGACKILANPFRMSQIIFGRTGDGTNVMIAPQHPTAYCVDPGLNTDAISYQISRHVEALLVPPVNIQAQKGLGTVLKQKLVAANRGVSQVYLKSDILTYSLRGLLAAGIASTTVEDNIEFTTRAPTVLVRTYFGVPDLNIVMLLLLLPVATTIAGIVIGVWLVRDRNKRTINFGLFSLTRLLLTPPPTQLFSQLQHFGDADAETWNRSFAQERGMFGNDPVSGQVVFGFSSQVEELVEE